MSLYLRFRLETFEPILPVQLPDQLPVQIIIIPRDSNPRVYRKLDQNVC